MAETVDWMNWAGVQLGSAWQMRKRKLRSNSVPLRRVPDLGMKLHRPDVARGIGDAGHGIGRARGEGKAGGQLQSLIAMRHPDIERRGQAGKQRDFLAGHDRHLGRAVLALVRGAYFAAQMMGEKLQAITDAEDRQSQGQHVRVRGRRIRVVDRAGASGEDQPDGMMRLDFGDGSGAGKDDREDILLSYAARDELRVLAAKIQDDDRGSIHVLVFQPFVEQVSGTDLAAKMSGW